jgi:tryptophan synthase alpha chain
MSERKPTAPDRGNTSAEESAQSLPASVEESAKRSSRNHAQSRDKPAIRTAFERGKVFIPFITAGDPDLETTEAVLRELAAAGAGIIEIGIPFSDPTAEGPVIQEADERALAAGTTVDQLFDLVARLSPELGVPLLFMTYYNPIFGYGVERFLDRCQASGIAGLIVPDLPFEEHDELLLPARARGIELISMIAPTSAERIAMIAGESSGFIYCVSSLGVTGVRKHLDNSAEKMIRAARKVTDTPCAVGFGISNPDQAAQMAQFADGVIIGSAIVRIIAEHGRESAPFVGAFARSIVAAINRR